MAQLKKWAVFKAAGMNGFDTQEAALEWAKAIVNGTGDVAAVVSVVAKVEKTAIAVTYIEPVA